MKPTYAAMNHSSEMKLRKCLSMCTLLSLGLFLGASILSGQSATINIGSPQQQIDGFGSSFAGFGGSPPAPVNLTPTLKTLFFDTLGFSVLRLQFYSDQTACNDDIFSGACPNASPTILAVGTDAAQYAAARGAKIFGSFWTPPASMKTGGTCGGYCGGSWNGGSTNNTNYAAIVAGAYTLMNANSLTLYGINQQNEPDINQTYLSATWTAAQIHDFIAPWASAMSSAGGSAVKLMVGEQSTCCSFSYTSNTMADASTAASVGVLTTHNYDEGCPTTPPSFSNFTTQRVWQTEVSNLGGTYDGSMTDGLSWGARIDCFIRKAQYNAWVWWELDCGVGYANASDNQCLTDQSGNIAKRAYVIGQWAKFVRPGWSMVSVTNAGALSISAFKDAFGGNYAIVAVNPGASQAETLTFSGGGCPVSAIPYLTDATNNLAQQSAASISGCAITYTVPASSVVTLSGTTGSGSSMLGATVMLGAGVVH